MALLHKIQVSLPKFKYSQNSFSTLLQKFTASLDPSFNNSYTKQIFENVNIKERSFIFRPERLFDSSNFKESYAEILENLGDFWKDSIRASFENSEIKQEEIDCIISATGIFAIPPLEVRVTHDLDFRDDVKRMPMTGTGCCGGAITLARAHDYLKGYPNHAVLVSTAECGSRFWIGPIQERLKQLIKDPKENKYKIINEILLASIFGDASQVCILLGKEHEKRFLHKMPEIIDSKSKLIKDSTMKIVQFAEQYGFRQEISKDLPQCASAMKDLVNDVLQRNNLTKSDIKYWCFHPGGTTILNTIEEGFNLSKYDMRFSWESIEQIGNCASVSVIDILKRAHEDAKKTNTSGYGIVGAIGPGVQLCVLLVKF